MVRRALRACVFLLLVAAPGCSWTRGFVYYPWRSGGGESPPAALSADELAAEDIAFVSSDGTPLHGWLAAFRGARRAVLVCHGNAGNVECRAGELTAIRRATRAHVLEFDYRGYGRSGGEPEEAGVQADAQAALDALGRATGIAPEATIVLGHSLGGAVAIDLASRRADVGGLVVVSSFTKVDDMVAHLALPGLGFLVPESWDSLSKVGAIACPKLFVHGDADGLIPFEQGVALHAKAREPKRFLRVPGGGHDDTLLSAESLARIARFASTIGEEASPP